MRSMRWALTGVVLVLVSCGGGSSPTSTDAVAEVVYNVGDTGPGGGIIFYVDEAGFTNHVKIARSIGVMCLTGTCHYLEMAPTDLEGAYFWFDAFDAAESYSTATADDWVLPSKDALNEMCKYAFGDKRNTICNDDGLGSLSIGVGGFSTDGHWSSTEGPTSGAWVQSFGSGMQEGNIGKDWAHSVRPVRAFSGSTSSTSESSSSSTSETSIGLCAQGGICVVGDTGPGGGIIVYVSDVVFDNSVEDYTFGAMCLEGTCQYLEMATADLFGVYSRNDAIAAAEAFSTPSANDWVLPSRNALNEICKYAHGDTVNRSCNDAGKGGLSLKDGNFWLGAYLSSSAYCVGECSENYWGLDLNTGQIGAYGSEPKRVRLVRGFRGSTSSSTSETSIGLCAQGGICVVGDTGPGGGIIVYVDDAGFNNSSGDETSIGAMCSIETCHYLEMAPTDLEGVYPWKEASAAAKAFSTPSANDWVLPSKDALNGMCKFAFSDTRNAICNSNHNGDGWPRFGGFAFNYYWSSSKGVGPEPWTQSFYLGVQSDNLFTGDGKTVAYVRPVRAF